MKKMLRKFNKVVSGKIGLTLTEILVAMTIFVIAATVAFVIYNLSRESFKKGELAVDQQQNTRVAFVLKLYNPESFKKNGRIYANVVLYSSKQL